MRAVPAPRPERERPVLAGIPGSGSSLSVFLRISQRKINRCKNAPVGAKKKSVGFGVCWKAMLEQQCFQAARAIGELIPSAGSGPSASRVCSAFPVRDGCGPGSWGSDVSQNSSCKRAAPGESGTARAELPFQHPALGNHLFNQTFPIKHWCQSAPCDAAPAEGSGKAIPRAAGPAGPPCCSLCGAA